MGKRDYRWRETKKVKKGTKKVNSTEIIPSPVMVEVVGKQKKECSAED